MNSGYATLRDSTKFLPYAWRGNIQWRNLGLHGLFIVAPIMVAGQSTAINTAFHPTSVNPAFCVSPIAYNQVLVQASPERIHGQAHYNLDALYTALGLGAENQTSGWSVSPMSAYHTYFLRSNQHLMGGVQMNLASNESLYGKHNLHASYRLGLLIFSNPGSRYFAGATFHMKEATYSWTHACLLPTRSGYGLQLGHGLPPISRRIRLNSTLFANYFQTEAAGTFSPPEFYSTHWQITAWMQQWFFGMGWLQENLDYHGIVFRAGYNRRIATSIAALIPLDTEQTPGIEITIKTKITK